MKTMRPLSSSATTAVVRAARRRARQGFTLIELTVSLGAGLIVAIAVIGLSKEATLSFNEEVRVSAAESSVRTAVDRLRADLQRASFMSTGNIQSDPLIAKAPGQPNISTTAAAAFPGLARLAGVRLYVGGSTANTPLSTLQTIPLNPDILELGGNFTSTDQFVVRNIDPAGGGACQRVWLAVDSPPMWRILATERASDGGSGGTAGAANANLANAFQPVATKQFFARVSDDSGCYQYVVTCGPVATGGASGAIPQPYLDIDPKTPILTTAQTGGHCGIGGLGSGKISVNPVQIVRWEITTAANEPASLAAMNPTGDSNKYDLVRSFVDAGGTVLTTSTEVIAEYAVDLKIAFTVDNGDVTGQAPQFLTLAFDDDTNNRTWAQDLTAMSKPFTVGPQRIRSVRYRLVTRAMIPDRTANIPVNPPNQTNERFLYRYCAGQFAVDGGAPDCTKGLRWTRARTVTGEVSLPNQSRMYFL